MKKIVSEQDQLGNAEIPSDLLTPSLGSNYGLDGYPDMEYGMGVLEGVSEPDLMPSPAFPTGLSKGAADDMDLTTMLGGETLADLDWLDPTQLQDPERLPHSTNDTVIPELVEAWGVHRRTNGVEVVARDLSQARYEDSLENRDAPARKASVAQMSAVVSKAMRRSAAGQDIDTVVKQALESMGEEMDRVAEPLRRVRAEHGLAGNVFIRASAYPGYGTGKWAQHIKRHASKARYLIVSQRELDGATWINNGRCAYTGKFAVTTVPWPEALAHYSPLLESAGRKVASPTAAGLRRAFVEAPGKKVREAWLPTHKAAADRVSAEEARQAFEASTPAERVVYDPEKRRAAKIADAVENKISSFVARGMLAQADADLINAARTSPAEKLRVAAGLAGLPRSAEFGGAINQANAMNRHLYMKRLEQGRRIAFEGAARIKSEAQGQMKSALAEMVRKGQISAEDQTRLVVSSEDPHLVLKAAAELALVRKASPYSGSANQAADANTERIFASLSEKMAHQARAQQELDRRQEGYLKEGQEGLDQKVERARVARVKAGCQKVVRAVKNGARGSLLERIVVRSFAEEDLVAGRQLLAPLFKKTGALAEVETEVYSGPTFTRNQEAAAHTEGPVAREARSAVAWVRRSMSEGFAGAALNELINQRFSQTVLTAAETAIDEARKAHEGGAGFLYVDAAAYATPTGVQGCEKGALKHRANQIPSVAAMDRCGSCTLVAVLPDGTSKCSVYNKALLGDTTGPELQRIKNANIRVANMNDGEQTQSFFAPAYDPNEFGLRNSNLEDVSPDLPEHEKVAEVIFGGWDF